MGVGGCHLPAPIEISPFTNVKVRRAVVPSDQYKYDVVTAEQLLWCDGYPNGFPTTLYSSNDPDTQKIDTAIHADLTTVGITVKINSIN